MALDLSTLKTEIYAAMTQGDTTVAQEAQILLITDAIATAVDKYVKTGTAGGDPVI